MSCPNCGVILNKAGEDTLGFLSGPHALHHAVELTGADPLAFTCCCGDHVICGGACDVEKFVDSSDIAADLRGKVESAEEDREKAEKAGEKLQKVLDDALERVAALERARSPERVTELETQLVELQEQCDATVEALEAQLLEAQREACGCPPLPAICGAGWERTAEGKRIKKAEQIVCALRADHDPPHRGWAPEGAHVSEWRGDGSGGGVHVPRSKYRGEDLLTPPPPGRKKEKNS